MTLPGHIDEEDLERYIMNRVVEPELALLEEHLLICYQCQQACLTLQQTIDALRRALGQP